MFDDRFEDQKLDGNLSCAEQTTELDEMLDELEGSWRALCTAAGPAKRREVTAMTIGRALPYAFIAERIAPGHARFRVAGSKISQIIGTEARGMPMSCLMGAGSRMVLSERLEQVFIKPQLMSMPITAGHAGPCPEAQGRILILPLRGDTGMVDRLLGAIYLTGVQTQGAVRCEFPLGQKYRRAAVTPNGPRLVATAAGANVERLRNRHPAQPQISGRLRLVIDND